MMDKWISFPTPPLSPTIGHLANWSSPAVRTSLSRDNVLETFAIWVRYRDKNARYQKQPLKWNLRWIVVVLDDAQLLALQPSWLMMFIIHFESHIIIHFWYNNAENKLKSALNDQYSPFKYAFIPTIIKKLISWWEKQQKIVILHSKRYRRLEISRFWAEKDLKGLKATKYD